MSCLSPKYTHESWSSLGADHVLDIEDLQKASSKLQFDLVINTGGPLMQDTCQGVATKRVISTLTTGLAVKIEYNVMYTFLAR